MKKKETEAPEVKKCERYLPHPSKALEMFTIDNSATRNIVQNRSPNVCVHTYRSHDVTPYRKNKFGPKDESNSS